MTSDGDSDDESEDHTIRGVDRDRDADTDPGSYIGRMPERATETIPGGLSRKDERVAAHSTQSGARRPATGCLTGTARAHR